MRDIVSVVLLVMGLGVVCLSCVAMASLTDPIDRLHVVTPASTLGVAATCAAVVVRDGLERLGHGCHPARRGDRRVAARW